MSLSKESSICNCIGKFTEFTSLEYYLFKKIAPSWGVDFMQTHLIDPSKISPNWALRFCVAVDKMGLDFCAKASDVYSLVTSNEAFKKKGKKFNSLFKEYIFSHGDDLRSEIALIFDANLKNHLLCEIDAIFALRDRLDKEQMIIKEKKQQKEFVAKKLAEKIEKNRLKKLAEEANKRKKEKAIEEAKKKQQEAQDQRKKIVPTSRSNVWRNPNSPNQAHQKIGVGHKGRPGPTIIRK